MQRFFGVAQDINGNAIPAATVTVNLAGTGTLATLFSDNAFMPLANPFTSNTDGTYELYAADGRYDIVLTKTNFTFTNSETADVLLQDVSSLISPAQIIADQNDYGPTNTAGATVWRISSSATRTITGLKAPTANANQRTIVLLNVGLFTILLSHQSLSSSAANRLILFGGATAVLDVNQAIAFEYDATISRWIQVSGTEMPRWTVIGGTSTSASFSAAAPTVAFTQSVPGGLLGTTGRLRMEVFARATNNSGGNITFTTQASYGGSALASASLIYVTGTAAAGHYFSADIHAQNATNSQICYSEVRSGQATTTMQLNANTLAVDSTIAQTLQVTVQSSATTTFVVDTVTVEYFR